MKKLIMSVAALSLLAACATDPYTGESKVSKTAWGTGCRSGYRRIGRR